MEYWTIIDDRHAGPFTAGQLMDRGLTPETPVWHAGLPDWVAAGEIDELRILLEQVAPQQPEPQGYQPEQPQSYQSPQQPQSYQSPQSPQSPQQPEQPQSYQSPQQPEQHQSYQSSQSYQQPEQPQSYQGYQPEPQPMQPMEPMQPQWDWQRRPAQSEPECPPTYLVWSIIVTVLCCLPFGIAAIVCSAQVKSAYSRGNLPKAEKMSEAAQWCIILSIVLGLLWIPVQMAFSGLF